jgi:hypothetical protein
MVPGMRMNRGAKVRFWTKSTQRPVVLLAAGLLILATGLCTFHGAPHNSHGHAMTPEPCVSMVLVLPPLLVRPVVNGWVASIPDHFVYAISADILDRPPEADSLL